MTERQLEQALVDDHRRTRRAKWLIASIFVAAALLLVVIDMMLMDRPQGWILAPPTTIAAVACLIVAAVAPLLMLARSDIWRLGLSARDRRRWAEVWTGRRDRRMSEGNVADGKPTMPAVPGRAP
jgi:protein-S-isoprenylcysteine O-methyltransferase Ste14